MPEQNQAILDLISAHERRLHKLQERAAKEGISTDPKVVIEIEDIQETLRELKRVKVLKIDDPILRLLLAFNATTRVDIGITLSVNGLMVAGYLTSPQKYGEHFWGNLTEEGLKIGLNPEVAETSRTTHLHLRDARLYPASGGPIPPYDQSGIFWRGKLSAIDSYALGRPTPAGWETPPLLIMKSEEGEDKA